MHVLAADVSEEILGRPGADGFLEARDASGSPRLRVTDFQATDPSSILYSIGAEHAAVDAARVFDVSGRGDNLMEAPSEEAREGGTVKLKDIGLAIADHVDAMLAYWDKNLVCRFANKAYTHWFGKTPGEMIDKITIDELLGPLYLKNLPYIEGVLNGNRQTFEREIPTPTGGIRYSLANYYPDIIGGEVVGFFVHVADISPVKKLEMEREKLISKLQSALREVKILTGLLPICAWCKNVRDDKGYWQQIENYISEHSDLSFTHSICTNCLAKLPLNPA